jgi:hypothetical protein
MENDDKIVDTMEEFFENLRKNYKPNFLDKWFPHGIVGYRPIHSLTHPWLILENIIDEIKYAWQRIFRGWDDKVIWSISSYLGEMIPIWVKKLQKESIGIPMDFYDEEDWNKETSEFKDGADERALIKYHLVLNQIITGFESYLKMEEVEYNSFEYKQLQEMYQTGFMQFQKYFDTLWW